MPAHLSQRLGVGFLSMGVLPLAMLSLVSAPAHAASVTIDLCAKTGSLTLPGPRVVPIWSFVKKLPNVDCGNNVQHVAQLPGPVLRVTNGDVVTINLHNRLSVPISLLIPGQVVTPLGGTAGTFTKKVAPFTVGGYRFTATTGTYIYESGENPNKQVAMGLHGALIVESGVPNQAYGPQTGFDTEAVLVLSEIDPNLHANPNLFNIQNYAPIYWLINGKAHPQTAPIPISAGQRVLLRYLNPSFNHHAMAVLGRHQQLIAREAFELATPINVVAETIAAGTTLDTIVTIPATLAPGTFFPVYNRNMRLTNGSPNGPGGMQTTLGIRPPPPPPDVQPLYFSTFANGTVPGVAGPYDDADIYKWDGAALTRVFDASAAGLPASANIEGLKVVDDDTFFVSFTAGVCSPSFVGFPRGGCALGSGFLAAGSIARYDAGTWSLFFDRVAAGLSSRPSAFDIDLASGTIYFSTVGVVAVPGVAGPYDDADIYRWNGSATPQFARIFDATAAFLPAAAVIDGLKVLDVDTFLISFANQTQVPGLGTVQDEDIVHYDAGTWSLAFDGTALGLTLDGQDIDAFDVP